jgi:hypothetical protein
MSTTRLLYPNDAAALRQQDLIVAGRCHFIRGVPDIVRRDELALLDIHHPARAARFEQQIRLAAQKRRDLQDVHHFRRRPACQVS